MRKMIVALAAAGIVGGGAYYLGMPTAQAQQATLYKNPQCGCCETYAEYLEDNGFEVEVVPTHDLAQISQDAGVPAGFQGCHTMMVDGYVVDGHVPIEIVRQMLEERPEFAGVTLPGMPTGSPGMGGEKIGPFTIYAFDGDGAEPEIYATD